MDFPAFRASLVLLGCLWLCPPVVAHAQPVQRCIGADGRAVYTDQPCEAVGAAARLPPAAGADGPRLFREGCPRVLSQLVGEIGAAIQGGDVNRLASVYDWSGVSDASASRLLDRLEAIVARPLVDIAPVYPDSGPTYATAASAPPEAPPPPPAEPGASHAGGPAAWMPSWNTHTAPEGVAAVGGAQPLPPGATSSDSTSSDGTGPGSAAPPPRPRPVALRIEQTLAGSATPVRTVFGLRRNYGCFWIAL